MFRQMAGRDQNGIEAAVMLGVFRIVGKPGLRGADNALLLARRYGIGRVVKFVARLHFDKHHGVAAKGDDVDFAQRAAKAAGQNAVPFGNEIGRGLAFARQADVKEVGCDEGAPGLRIAALSLHIAFSGEFQRAGIYLAPGAIGGIRHLRRRRP